MQLSRNNTYIEYCAEENFGGKIQLRTWRWDAQTWITLSRTNFLKLLDFQILDFYDFSSAGANPIDEAAQGRSSSPPPKKKENHRSFEGTSL
jgi:hypothetical protein